MNTHEVKPRYTEEEADEMLGDLDNNKLLVVYERAIRHSIVERYPFNNAIEALSELENQLRESLCGPDPDDDNEAPNPDIVRVVVGIINGVTNPLA